MVLSNPKATYKAQLLNYDTLLLASDNECTYCLSEREVQMLLAFVDYIGWKTRYISTETEIDTVLIGHWSSNLARKLMSGCCGDNELHRFTPTGIYQSSQDGGITWFDDTANDPRNDAIQSPPLAGVTSDAKRCAAADNVRDLFEQYRDNLIEIVGATPSIIAIIAGILAFVGTILGLSGVGIGIGVLFLTMAAEIISIGGTGISGEITFTALQDFRCIVYCRMDGDGRLDYGTWQEVLSDIAAHYSGFAETFFYQTVMGMGYIGVNNAGTFGVSTASDCSGCDCDCGGETIGLGMVLFFGTLVNQTGCNLQSTSLADGPLFSTTWQWDGTNPFKLIAEGLLSGDTGTSQWQWYLGDGTGPFFGASAPVGQTLSVLELSGNNGAFTVSWDVATP